MTLRRILLIAIVLAAPLLFGENTAPRDIWAQAATSAMNGDLNTAVQKTNELLSNGPKSYGIASYPAYATAAAAMARQADKLGKTDVADWAAKVAQQLDPRSPTVAFMLADRARDHGDWASAIKLSMTGYTRLVGSYAHRLLARADLTILFALTVALSSAIFAVALFIRYCRSAAHDFREFLGLRFRGGAVTVLALALLFLPLFLWLGPIWLVLYWFVIFFGYAEPLERIAIGFFCLVIAVLPVILDRAATQIAGIDGPIVQATILSTDQSYRPESLRRVEEITSIVSDNYVVHLLLGNLQLQEGNDQQAREQYRRAADLKDSAGAHVNLGNLHYLNNDFAASITEYEKAEQMDPKLAIAFYNNSLASGELYHFDDQGKQLEQAKKLNRAAIERLTQNPPPQKIMFYTPPLSQAWEVSTALASHGTAQTLFGTYSYFDGKTSLLNPITLGSVLALVLAIAVWQWKKKAGYANSCIKCGRTFCHRCKSSRESATYCTQCIHIYLKRDGVALDTKRRKLEEVQAYLTGALRRNRIMATVLPGSAQVLEGRTATGVIGMLAFVFFVATAVMVGRLAPAVGPVAETAKLLARSVSGALAVIIWMILSLPVYRRKQSTV